MNEHKQDSVQPKTDTIPKQVKKSFIAWLVPTLSLGVLMCVFLVVQNWADGRYTTRAAMDSEASMIRKSLSDEQTRRENLEQTVSKMDRKLDLIIYIMQHDGKMDPNTAKSMLPNP